MHTNREWNKCWYNRAIKIMLMTSCKDGLFMYVLEGFFIVRIFTKETLFIIDLPRTNVETYVSKITNAPIFKRAYDWLTNTGMIRKLSLVCCLTVNLPMATILLLHTLLWFRLDSRWKINSRRPRPQYTIVLRKLMFKLFSLCCPCRCRF